MNDDIEKELIVIESLAEGRLYKEAVDKCTSLLGRYPREFRVLDKRARLFARLKKWQEAIEDISEVVVIKPEEPCYFFTRARWKVEAHEYAGAIMDIDKLIDLENMHKDKYYIESAFFFRAIANVMLGCKEQARADLENVRDNFSLFALNKIQSKSGLLESAE